MTNKIDELIKKYKKQEEDGLKAQSMLYPSCPRVKHQIDEASSNHKAIQKMRDDNKRMRQALEEILIAAEFHGQEGVTDYVMRYAHESTFRLAKQALDEIDD